MSNVIKFKRPSLVEKHKGKFLCKSGFHDWKIQKDQPFNVRQGLLVTSYRCSRCGQVKNMST